MRSATPGPATSSTRRRSCAERARNEVAQPGPSTATTRALRVTESGQLWAANAGPAIDSHRENTTTSAAARGAPMERVIPSRESPRRRGGRPSRSASGRQPPRRGEPAVTGSGRHGPERVAPVRRPRAGRPSWSTAPVQRAGGPPALPPCRRRARKRRRREAIPAAFPPLR